MYRFLYDRDLHHERFNDESTKKQPPTYFEQTFFVVEH